MMRVMFDSNAFDAALAHGDADRIRSAVIVAITSVQADEIHQVADAVKRQRLFDLLHHLRVQRVPAVERPIAASRDAVILATAARHCDCLVTEDKGMALTGLRVLSYADFRQEFLS